MFRRLLIIISLAGVFGATFLLVAYQPGGNDIASPTSAPTATPVTSPHSLYDSIRTDLDDYAWPTDAGRAITSTFGEFRRTHFHAGLDISTHDRVGYRTFAARDGYISTISVGPEGYGRMLFVRHSDGYTTTYAHLQKFTPELEARVASEQRARGCFPVEIECRPSEFPVRKGDLIAYTGESGTGDPHLHFEIRDEHDNGVNPLLGRGMTIFDDIPPQANSVAVVPLGEDGRADGQTQPRVLRARQQQAGVATIGETVDVSGSFGFAVNVRDRSNGTWFRHGVYSHTLHLDDSVLFRIRLDRVPMNEPQQIGLYYHWPLLRGRRGRFEKLYADAPNDLPMYSPSGTGGGIISAGLIAEGRHTYRIVSEDFNGNTSTISGTVFVRHAPSVALSLDGTHLVIDPRDGSAPARYTLELKRTGGDQWDRRTVAPEAGFVTTETRVVLDTAKYDIVRVVGETAIGTQTPPSYLVLRTPDISGQTLRCSVSVDDGRATVSVSSSGYLFAAPSVIAAEGSERRSLPMKQIDLHSWTGSFVPSSSHVGTRTVTATANANGQRLAASDTFAVYPIVAGRSGQFTLDNGNFSIEYDSAAVFGTLFLRIDKTSEEDATVYVIDPPGGVLREGFRVSIRPDHHHPHQGLFMRTTQGWRMISAQSDSFLLRGSVRRTLGDIAVMVDDTAPFLDRVSVGRHGSPTPTVSFSFGDDLSGVDYQSMKAYIDGQLCIPDIDGEHRRASFRQSDPLERGSHRLTIQVTDRMGNAANAEREFVVR